MLSAPSPPVEPHTHDAPPAAVEPVPSIDAGLHAEPAVVNESQDLDVWTLETDRSTSVGSPSEGTLEGGVALPLHGRGFRFHRSTNPLARFGTVELVQAIVRAAAIVDATVPGGELTVGDLSLRTGGDIPGHGSHRNGRDVDLMFYLLDSMERPREGKAIPIEPDGRGVDYRDLARSDDDISVRLDVARTWTLVAALVAEPTNAINRIFVAEHVRTLLLDHAKRIHAEPDVMGRFGGLTCQPAFPHDDHLHVRFFCSAEDIARGCLDTPPIYPWQKAQLAEQGASVHLAGRRTRPVAALTSTEEAKARAQQQFGVFAPEVTAFLQRRDAWVKQPHPGRPYCR